MNGFQRCLKALNWEFPDRVPVIPQNSDMAIHLSGYSMRECLYDARKLAFALLQAQEKMGYDGIMLGPDAAILAEVLGAEVAYRDDDPPAVVAPLLSDISEIDKLKEIDLLKSERIRTWLEATQILLEKSRGNLFIICRADQGAFSLATLLRGSQEFLLDLAMGEQKEKIHKLLAFCNEVHIQFARLIKSVGAHATTCGDAYCGPGLISPNMYAEYVLPYHCEAVHQIKGKIGLPYSIHICGYTDPIHDLWVQSGATFFEIDHMTDIVSLRLKTRGKISLFGNLDTSSLCFETPEVVKKNCLELFKQVNPDTGFILSSGCSMSGNTKIENVQAMLEAAQDFQINKVED